MGGIAGSVISGIGALAGGSAASGAAGKAVGLANQGYNYLTSGPGGQAATGYINAGQTALGNQGTLQNQELGLLGLGNQQANQAAFNNYLGSTGYKFQLGQGTGAINANAASRGLLDSGANAKALNTFGQNLASTSFNNYLGQLSGANAQAGQTAQLGQNMLTSIGQIGTQAGGNAANAQMAQGSAQGNMWNTLGGIGSGIASSSGFGNALGGLTNFLSGG